MAAQRTRREFLALAGATAGGLIVGFTLPAGRLRAAAPADAGINAFVQIAPSGAVTLVVGKSEMGQGTFTGYAQLIAEELEVDWTQVRVVSAPVDAAYNAPGASMQYTGGSSSVRTGFRAMREAGAQARTMLVGAAAERLGVPASELVAAAGRVRHPASGREFGYGALAADAARQPVPAAVALKPPSAWTLIGRPLKRLDAAEKCSGRAGFGLDVRLPGQQYAMLVRAPHFGGTVAAVDDAAARRVPGVVRIVRLERAVAVIATTTHAARRGRDALVVRWHDGPGAGFSSAELARRYAATAATPGAVAHAAGTLPGGAPTLTADYATPYLAHAPMEPLNCTVAFGADGCDIHTGTQMQTLDRASAAAAAGLPVEKVRIHTPYLGGGFGRRASAASDFVREAVLVAKDAGRPVMTVWSREDDLRGGYYRPQSHQRLGATLGADGRPTAWTHSIVMQSVLKGTPFGRFADPQTGLDHSTHEGASTLPYRIPALRVEVHDDPQPVPVLWWRSVGHSNTAFAVESFIDECAHAAGADPLAYRLALLDEPRHRAALTLAAEKAGWGTPLPAGRARGLAVHESFGSVVAEVAEVSLVKGRPRVHRVVVAIHCGTPVNPNLIAQQLESAVVFGLSAALDGEITLDGGRVQQSNFSDYPVLRLDEAPLVETHLVPSDEAPTGVGEPGTPPVAPAVANALYALTKVRARRLPLAHTEFGTAPA